MNSILGSRQASSSMPYRLAGALAVAVLASAFTGCQSPQSESATAEVQPVAAPNIQAGDGSVQASATPASAVSPTTDDAACPSQYFNEFLQAFASDEGIRKRFTAPVVKVARVEEGEDGDQVVMKSIPAAQYDGFLLSYRDGKYGFAGAGSEAGVGNAGLQVIVKAEPTGSYFVTFPDNVEAISYRFERHGNCWRLSEDPEANV